MKSAFYFKDNHAVLTFPNGISISMCNHEGSHSTRGCRNALSTNFSDTVEVLVTREVGGKKFDITGHYFEAALPDAANVSLQQIIELINVVRFEA